MDARALAALRVSLGFLLLADLAVRARDLEAFYTDAGVFPRAANAEVFSFVSSFSLHMLSGDPWFQVALFVLAAAFAVALMLGYRTKLALGVSLALLVSLHARNWYVLNGGDRYLMILLFLTLFLPVGRRWSLDAAGGEGVEGRDGDEVVSAAAAVLLLQLLVLYLTNFGFKVQRGYWLTGDAVIHIFRLERFMVLLGDHLTMYPEVLVFVNWSWLVLLGASPLLVLFTGRARASAVAVYVSAHVGMLLTMRLGLFPLIMTAGLLPFLPSFVWDDVEDWTTRIYEGPPASWLRPPEPSPKTSKLRSAFAEASPYVVTLFLVATVVWQAMALGFVATPGALEDDLDPEDNFTWKMFALDGPSHDKWFVAPASLESGRQVDVYGGGEVNLSRPDDVTANYPSLLWHRYMTDLRWASETTQSQFADYLCRQGYQGEEVANLSVYEVRQMTADDGYHSPRERELYRTSCS